MKKPMRSSFSKNVDHHEKSRKRMTLLFSLLMVFILVGSSLAYVVLYYGGGLSGANSIEEYGYSFSQISADGMNYWQTKIDDQKHNFIALPSQVETVTLTDSAKFSIDRLAAAPFIAVSFMPSVEYKPFMDYALFQLYADGQEQTNKAFYFGVKEPSADYPTLNQFSCDNQSALNVSGAPTIELFISNETRVDANGHCVQITGFSGADLLYALERFRYEYYGVSFTNATQ
ncbi:MAG TPA: hypothetical protein VK158_04345 [Acidobacteriota bacterium]|nr:hypothetical protein [Acidobacteriota bacterium]